MRLIFSPLTICLVCIAHCSPPFFWGILVYGKCGIPTWYRLDWISDILLNQRLSSTPSVNWNCRCFLSKLWFYLFVGFYKRSWAQLTPGNTETITPITSETSWLEAWVVLLSEFKINPKNVNWWLGMTIEFSVYNRKPTLLCGLNGISFSSCVRSGQETQR